MDIGEGKYVLAFLSQRMNSGATTTPLHPPTLSVSPPSLAPFFLSLLQLLASTFLPPSFLPSFLPLFTSPIFIHPLIHHLPLLPSFPSSSPPFHKNISIYMQTAFLLSQ